MTTREIALSYLEKGLSVIPMKSPSTVKRSTKFKEMVQAELEKNAALPEPRPEKDIYKEMFIIECKKPLLAWTEYQKRLPTKEEVNHWFNTNPDANIGIVTGAVSNLVVFDLDSERALEYAEEQGGFPEDTVKVKSGKGYHVYMRHPGFYVNNKVNLALTIDIRADGGLIAAPPSMHGSGHQYQWVEGFSIFETDPAECSPWMIDYLQAVKNVDSKPKSEVKKDLPHASAPKEPAGKITSESGKKSFTGIIANGCVAGERNHTATSLIGHLIKTMAKEEAWEIVNLWNDTKNKPPLSSDELKSTFQSVLNMEQKGKVIIDTFLDNANSVIAEYNQNYVRIPFAGQTLQNLEKQMNGGLAGGRFYIVGGIPSSGKTVLLNNIADNICLNGYPVLFFSYDDGKDELRYRSFARFSEHNIEAYNLNRIPDLKKVFVNPFIKQILSLKYVIKDMIPVEKWPDLVEQIKKKHGKGPVIIVDYLRKLKTESKTSDERLRVDDIINKLTQLAKNQNIPVVTISELARDSYKSGQRLSMASFKESGTIEYEASWLGILAAVVEGKNGEYILKDNWENIIAHDGNIDLIVFKAKRGTGQTGKVPLKVDKNKMTVMDRIDEKQPATKLLKASKFSI